MPDDTRALTEDEQAAMRAALVALQDDRSPGWPLEDDFEAGFIAGLRYRDGAEPSEAEVEAAILAAYNDQPQWFGGTMTRPSDRRPKTFEECYGCAPLEHAESRRDVELILEAARKASP